MLRSFSHVHLFVTLWTVACQTPLSMPFSRGFPQPRDWILLCLLQRQAGSLPLVPPGKPKDYYAKSQSGKANHFSSTFSITSFGNISQSLFWSVACHIGRFGYAVVCFYGYEKISCIYDRRWFFPLFSSLSLLSSPILLDVQVNNKTI